MARTQESSNQRSTQHLENGMLRLILGKDQPDAYTRIACSILAGLAAVFLLWNVLGYVALTYQHLIHVHRHVAIDTIFAERGAQLGLSAEEFTQKLRILFLVSICCWLLVLFALTLLWRKKMVYFPLLLTGVLLYVGMLFFYLGYDYFRTDTSLFDKISILVVMVISTLHYYLLKNEQAGEGLSFFGEDED